MRREIAILLIMILFLQYTDVIAVDSNVTVVKLGISPDNVKSTPSPLILSDGVVVAINNLLKKICFDGREIWTSSIPYRVKFLLETDSSLLVFSEGGSLYLVDAVNGNVLDSISLGGEVSTQPIISSGMIYVPLSSGNLITLNLLSLRRAWSIKLDSVPRLLTSFSGGVAVATSKNTYLIFSSSYIIPINIVLMNIGSVAGKVVGITDSRDVVLIDKDGSIKVLTSIKSGFIPAGQLVSAGNNVYILTGGGSFIRINVVDGSISSEMLDMWPLCQPLISEGAIVALGSNSIIIKNIFGTTIYKESIGGLSSVASFRGFSESGEAYLASISSSGDLIIDKIDLLLFFGEKYVKDRVVNIYGDICLLTNSEKRVSLYMLDNSTGSMKISEIAVISPGFCKSISISASVPENWTYLIAGFVIDGHKLSPIISAKYQPQVVTAGEIKLKMPDSVSIPLGGTENISLVINNTMDTEEFDLSAEAENVVLSFPNKIKIEKNKLTEVYIKILGKQEGVSVLHVKILSKGEVLAEGKTQLKIVPVKVLDNLNVVQRDNNFFLLANLTNRIGDKINIVLEIYLDGIKVNQTNIYFANKGESKGFAMPVKLAQGNHSLSAVVSANGIVIDRASRGIQIGLGTQTSKVSLANIPYLLAAFIIALASIGGLLVYRRRKKPAYAARLPPKPPATVPSLEKIETEVPEAERLPEVALEKPEEEKPRELMRPEVNIEEIKDRIGGVKSELLDVKSLNESIEGEVGEEVFHDEISELEERISEVEGLLSSNRLDEAANEIDKLAETVSSLKKRVIAARQVLINNWDVVEKRIDIMLRIWGRAPSSMLTMVPPELRMVALKMYAKKRGDVEIVGDEIRKKESAE
jgi:outer membrane protein assembly factor BamB